MQVNITDQEKLDFLMALREGKTIQEAAKEASRPVRSFYYLKKQDTQFSEAWDSCKKESNLRLLDTAEEVLRKRAMDISDPKSHILLIFMLKKLNPEYKENYKEVV